MICVNITGGQIRTDKGGQGHWYADRIGHKHKGIDLLLPRGAGQACVSPHDGIIERVAYPYGDDWHFKGLLLRGPRILSKIFYVAVPHSLVGKHVMAGQYIGKAQAISKKYKDVEDHIHWEVVEMDPSLLI